MADDLVSAVIRRVSAHDPLGGGQLLHHFHLSKTDIVRGGGFQAQGSSVELRPGALHKTLDTTLPPMPTEPT
jgi:hypothetical protein